MAAVALGAAALVHLLRYLLLVINRNTLLNWLVADAAGLMEALGFRDAIFVGLSIGGVVAQGIAAERPEMVDGVLRVPIRQRKGTIVEAVHRLNEVGIGIDDVAMRRPTLDDVFLTLTGRSLRDAEATPDTTSDPTPEEK